MNFINPKKIISQAAVGIGSVVADFGFGKGDFLRFLSKEVGPEGKIYAIDIQESVLQRVRNEFSEEGILNTEFLNTNLEIDGSTKLEKETADFILISSLFFQLEDKSAVAKEALRILKPKGRILFID
jgi:ubiquinone/menaquinone biosynthesis C-methylase UbiE